MKPKGKEYHEGRGDLDVVSINIEVCPCSVDAPYAAAKAVVAHIVNAVTARKCDSAHVDCLLCPAARLIIHLIQCFILDRLVV